MRTNQNVTGIPDQINTGVIHMKKKLAVFLVCALFLCVLSACGQDDYQADMDFTYILPQTVTSLDPQTAKNQSEKMMITAIFEGLCRLDETGQVIPGSAEKWESNEDYTEFTFYLRKNACWSENTPLTAYDYLYGIQRALMPSTGATAVEDLFIIRGASAVRSGEADMDTLGVEVLDEHTIRFYLENSYSDFPKLTAGVRYMPCNEEFFLSTGGKYGLECLSTLTNGPFTFATNYSWYKGEYIQLARTVNYYGEHKTVPASLKMIMKYDAALSADPLSSLYSGRLDLLRITENQVAAVQEKGCEVITLNDSVCGFLINTDDSLLEDIGLREVLTKTIDREALIGRIGQEKVEATGIVPRCVKWNGSSYRKGGEIMFTLQDDTVINNLPGILEPLELTKMPSITVICPDDELSREIATGLIVSWNKKLKNSFNIAPLDAETYQSRIESGNYQAAVYNLSANGTSPVSVLGSFSSSATPMILGSETYDEELKNSAFNMESYHALEETIMNKYIFYPVCYTSTHYAVSPFVKGVTVTPDSGADFSQAYKRVT